MVFNFRRLLTVMPFFDIFAQFEGFPLFLLQFLQNLIHGLGISKERILVFEYLLEGFKGSDMLL